MAKRVTSEIEADQAALEVNANLGRRHLADCESCTGVSKAPAGPQLTALASWGWLSTLEAALSPGASRCGAQGPTGDHEAWSEPPNPRSTNPQVHRRLRRGADRQRRLYPAQDRCGSQRRASFTSIYHTQYVLLYCCTSNCCSGSIAACTRSPGSSVMPCSFQKTADDSTLKEGMSYLVPWLV